MTASLTRPPRLPDEAMEQLPGWLKSYLETLHDWIDSQQETIEQLRQELAETRRELAEAKQKIAELERGQAKDSNNSSKPPGQDGLKKKKRKNSRQRSGKKAGGQPGHQGRTLRQTKNPDRVETHAPTHCTTCQTSLGSADVIGIEKRQVFDVPEPKLVVTEHRCESKVCPHCGCVNVGTFPVGVTGPTQWGPRMRAIAAYLGHQQFLPAERVVQTLEAIFGGSPSAGTLSTIDRELWMNLKPFEEGLKQALAQAGVLHADETGMRCLAKLHWVHSASTEVGTYYFVHERRGVEAMTAGGVLPSFVGILVHDHWKPYFRWTDATHALCNAHILRELKFVFEECGEVWAKQMHDLLLEMNSARDANQPLEPLKKRYAEVILWAFEQYKSGAGPPPSKEGVNLWKRLLGFKDCVLRFLESNEVPFTNNLAERDIRMVKLRVKISGGFRTLEGARIFLRIRSYLSTAAKQGWDALEALIAALQGRAFLPVLR